MKEIAPAVVIAVALANVAEVVADIVQISVLANVVTLAEGDAQESVVVHAQGNAGQYVRMIVGAHAKTNVLPVALLNVMADVKTVA